MSSERRAGAGSGELALSVQGLGKCYHIYDKPQHRLLQGLFRGRRKFHRDFWALREVSFEVRRGETIGVVGRNGSGKSTLLQLVCGTLTPSEGRVRTRGRIGALLELGSGFNPEFTGRENVRLNASILGLDESRIDERFASIAAFADIGDFIEQPVKTYSSGMLVRLAFAVVAHMDADVLIIDEALAVGDALFTQKCMRFLHEFRQRGTIFFVSHDTGAVLNLCDRAMWLSEGRMVRFGDAKSVVEGYVRWNMEQLQGTTQRNLAAVVPAPADSASAGAITEGGQADVALPQGSGGPQETPSAGVPVPLEDEGFGRGGAVIEHAGLHQNGQRVNAVRGGERVTLRIAARARTPLLSPILGFHLKDRLGQVLWGDNSFLSTAGAPLALESGDAIVAEFEFVMPHLRSGEYVFDVAFAEGTQAAHVQHHWVYDALVVHVVTDVPVFGLLSLPARVSLRRDQPAIESGVAVDVAER